MCYNKFTFDERTVRFMNDDELRELIEPIIREVRDKAVYAGYRACCNHIVSMIDENVPIENIRNWCKSNNEKISKIEENIFED